MGKRGVSRREFLRTSLFAAAGASVPFAAYAQLIEPHHLTVERLELRVPNLPESFDGFRIAQLSDFHYGPYTGKRDISAAVNLVNSLAPDLVALTGDFITAPEREGKRPPANHPVYTEVALCAEVLSGLKARRGIFACAGNHDVGIGAEYVAAALRAFGISLLSNENRAIEQDGNRLWIAGIDDAIFATPDLGRTLSGIPRKEPILLLAHEPDLADAAAKFPFTVQLSGHSHGGQIRLPLVGAPFLPPLARKYPYGYYRVRNMHLYTNRGIGTILLPYRFNAPPEVTVVTLRCAARVVSQDGRFTAG